MGEFYAPWYDEIPEGDFISKGVTYECGTLLSLFHKDSYSYDGITISYYWYDPRENGFPASGKYPLLSFFHGTSNSFVGDMCINYTGAERYASEAYQKTMGGAFILVPIANEYTGDDGRVHGYWDTVYLSTAHELILDFIANRAEGVSANILLGNSSGATFVLRLMDRYMDDFDVVIPVGSSALPDDAGLDRYDDKGKCLFLAIGKKDEFHPFREEIEPRLPRINRMKKCFVLTPEWVRNGDGGIASIKAGIEMGQHCLMNGVQANLMFDDGTPMDSRLPEGLTGWIRDYLKK